MEIKKIFSGVMFEKFQVYFGYLVASIFNIESINIISAVLQCVLTSAIIWFTIKKGKKK